MQLSAWSRFIASWWKFQMIKDSWLCLVLVLPNLNRSKEINNFLIKKVVTIFISKNCWKNVLTRNLLRVWHPRDGATCEKSDPSSRDGFRERGAVGHLSFWGPTQVWPIWSLVLKAWKYLPLTCNSLSKFYFLWCRLWLYDCLRSSTEIKAFPAFFSTSNGSTTLSWKLYFFL